MMRVNVLPERFNLTRFQALPGPFAARDAQDLMAYPFFSLSKSHRTVPIDFSAGAISIRVEAIPNHGMATIWDADILIWAASQIVQARDRGLTTSRLMAATPHEILTFVGRGASLRDYLRLKAALDRLQSTTVATSIRQSVEGRRHRFSWINEWQERTDHRGRPAGIELILPDWFYSAVLDDAMVLTIDRAYFSLTGGLDRWLYRLVRKHGGRQRAGWRFESFRRKSRSCRRRSPRRVRRQHRRGSPLSPRREMQRQIMPISMAVNRAGAVVHVAILAGGRILAATPTMRMSRSRTSDKHQSHYQPRLFHL